MPQPVESIRATTVGHSQAGSSALPHCAACGTGNDPDAAFCKRCGTRLDAVTA
jgi:hypothetical protein